VIFSLSSDVFFFPCLGVRPSSDSFPRTCSDPFPLLPEHHNLLLSCYGKCFPQGGSPVRAEGQTILLPNTCSFFPNLRALPQIFFSFDPEVFPFSQVPLVKHPIFEYSELRFGHLGIESAVLSPLTRVSDSALTRSSPFLLGFARHLSLPLIVQPSRPNLISICFNNHSFFGLRFMESPQADAFSS